ncbi:Do family serine endopeptidase [Treponema parvum]|uniref:Do family serine endopeptidase n=1 Tax=Treponema parvum TaxID=138851 RepID=A0A975F4V3_9SPIR|nr:Do family serine endopeptidase [Treponema parvum]QTQ14333.1 Do family serine endopeptidase [Treponema parvum]
MKKWTKYLIGAVSAAVLSFGLVSLYYRGVAVKGSAATAFAETKTAAVSIPQDSLKVVESLQNAFRSISSEVLPAVVEVDVTEKKTVTPSPFENMPFFFFGNPNDRNRQESTPREYEQKGLGSGVIVRRSGKTIYVLTNNHVAGKATDISVKLNDGRQFSGKLVGADERMDVALVSFESSDNTIPVAVLGDSDKVQAGDICLAMGAPLGYSQSVTQGIISATGRSGSGIGNVSDFIQTDAAINQGNSGGPLVNIYGEVIGLNTWIASSSGGSQGLGFSIPINNLKHAIDAFINEGKISYGWLGVSLIEISDEYKESLGVSNKTGAFAAQVFIDSPAYKAGLQSGDYITSLDGHEIKSVDQLVREVGNLRAGKNAEFGLIRGGKPLSVKVKIEERKADVAANDGKTWPGFLAVPLTDKLREQLKIDDKNVKGVVVSNIYDKTPAASLRLQEGDIITAVNGKRITNLQEFYSAMDLTKTKSISFDVYTNGGTITTSTYKIK